MDPEFLSPHTLLIRSFSRRNYFYENTGLKGSKFAKSRNTEFIKCEIEH